MHSFYYRKSLKDSANTVSRNGPRPREQYGYLSAGEILYNYDVIISDGNLVGTRCLGDSQGKFARVCKLARVRDSGSHVPPNGYNLYTCSILFGDCTRV
jgi:hypothetical protein